MPRVSDSELVRRALAGDNDAVGELFQRHSTRAWRAAYRVLGDRELADDALQDGFIRVMRGLASFRPDGDFGAWAATIAANCARSIVDARRRRPTSPLDERIADGRTPEDAIGAGEVTQAVRDLPEDQRTTVFLREVAGLSTAETAAATGVSEGTVKSRLARASARLRSRLGGAEGDADAS